MMEWKELECSFHRVMEEFHVRLHELSEKVNAWYSRFLLHQMTKEVTCGLSYHWEEFLNVGQEESSMSSHPRTLWKQQKQRAAVRVKQQREPKRRNSSSLSFLNSLKEKCFADVVWSLVIRVKTGY